MTSISQYLWPYFTDPLNGLGVFPFTGEDFQVEEGLMQASVQAQVLSQRESDQCSWMAFLKENFNALFQTALLLSADPVAAEASVAAALDEFDTSSPPGEHELASLHRAVAMHAIMTEPVSSSLAECRSMLQSGLWPVLQLERSPRACFVMRMLLGYMPSSCARALGIGEPEVDTLVQKAIFQLHLASKVSCEEVF